MVGYHAFAVTGGKNEGGGAEKDAAFGLTAGEMCTLLGISAFYDTVVVQTAVYGVVKGGLKLVAPSVKAEVEQRVGRL